MLRSIEKGIGKVFVWGVANIAKVLFWMQSGDPPESWMFYLLGPPRCYLFVTDYKTKHVFKSGPHRRNPRFGAECVVKITEMLGNECFGPLFAIRNILAVKTYRNGSQKACLKTRKSNVLNMFPLNCFCMLLAALDTFWADGWMRPRVARWHPE